MTLADTLPQRFVLTGTDTGVGKTVVAAILTAALKATYWKPVQSGLDETTDTDLVRALTQLPARHFLPEAYRLRTPISPHASARLDGVRIDRQSLTPPLVEGRLIIEGAGGLLVPLDDDTLLLDVLRDWRLPVLLVSRSRLGTINHTLLSLLALRSAGLTTVGVVLNGPPDPVSREAIEVHGKVTVLAEIPALDEVSPQTIGAVAASLLTGAWGTGKG